jgi:hypothetical protein
MQKTDTVDIIFDWIVRWIFPISAVSVIFGVIQDWNNITLFRGVFVLTCAAIFIATSICRWKTKLK